MKTKTMAVASLLALSVSAPSFAAKNETSANKSVSESKSFFQQLKDSPLSLYTELETEADFALTEYKGSKLDSFLSYKLTDKDKLKSQLRLKVKSIGDDEYETTYEYGYLGYSRSKILTEEKHGVNATGQIRFYKYGESGSADGGAQGRLYLNKKFSEKLSSAGVFLAEERINPKDGKTLRYGLFEGGPTYKLTKKINLGSTLYFGHFISESSNSTDGSISLDPSYKISDKLNVSNSVTLYGDFSGSDNKYAVLLTPTVSYSMNDDLSATLEYEASALRIANSEVSGRQFINNGKLALTLAYNAF